MSTKHTTESVKCATCDSNINGKILSALGKTYHPEHFTCAACKKPITDGKFQQNDGKPYCEDDYAKMFLKKCKACNKPIKNKIIKALGADWHEEHFVCTACKGPLVGASFMEKEGKPYCSSCYNSKFADKCKGCGDPITDQAIIALNEKWHQTCFVCLKCKKPVTDSTFQVQDGHPLCTKCAA